MKAKFIYESIGDILKPKSKEDIDKNLSKMSQKDLNNGLIYALWNEDNEKAQIFLDYGADVNCKDIHTDTIMTPLDIAEFTKNNYMYDVMQNYNHG